MDVKTAIRNGDADALQQLLAQSSSLANDLIVWGQNNKCLTHPLHYVSDMLFDGTLPKGKELRSSRRSSRRARISIFKRMVRATRH